MILCAQENLVATCGLLEFLRLAFDEITGGLLSEKYGYARHVAHQDYYLPFIGRSYEWELMPLGLGSESGRRGLESAASSRLRLTAVKIRRSQPLPEVSRLQSKLNAEIGPPVADEFLYNVIDAIDAIALETGKSVPQIALNWLLQRPTVSTLVIGARNEEQLRSNLDAIGWKLTPEQIARLDAVSDVPPAYPYWHQGIFAERNPAPV